MPPGAQFEIFIHTPLEYNNVDSHTGYHLNVQYLIWSPAESTWLADQFSHPENDDEKQNQQAGCLIQ